MMKDEMIEKQKRDTQAAAAICSQRAPDLESEVDGVRLAIAAVHANLFVTQPLKRHCWPRGNGFRQYAFPCDSKDPSKESAAADVPNLNVRRCSIPSKIFRRMILNP